LELEGIARQNFGIDALLNWGVNASTKFGGTAPLKIWENKKRPKYLVRFTTTFKFDREYL